MNKHKFIPSKRVPGLCEQGLSERGGFPCALPSYDDVHDVAQTEATCRHGNPLTWCDFCLSPADDVSRVLRESAHANLSKDTSDLLARRIVSDCLTPRLRVSPSREAFEALRKAATFARNRLLQDSGDQESIDTLNRALALAEKAGEK